jgi:phage terminase large subunit
VNAPFTQAQQQAAIQVDADFPPTLRCLFEPRRYKVLWGGRSAGRSWGVARALLLIGAKRKIRVLCCREFQKSIEDSVYKVIVDQIEKLGLSQFYVVQANKIFGQNGTEFMFEGIKNNTNKVKSTEGIDYCWVEEAEKVSKSSWGILIPTVRKENSEIIMTFNPGLKTDYTYVRWVLDKELKKIDKNRSESAHSIVVKMTYADNPWLPKVMYDEMTRDKDRDYDFYLNVWEGNCLENLEGAVYAKELRKIQLEGRICSVPYEPSVPVGVFFDLGRADQTAVWFVQRVAMQWRLLRYLAESGRDWSYWLKEIQRQEYIVGSIYLPHDAKAKRLGTRKTIEEQTRLAGFNTIIVPKLSRVDGINASRIVMGSCWFDQDGCEDGVNALRHYRYKVVDGQLSNEPLHDWASDGADAFRYFAISAALPRERNDVDSRLARAKGKAIAMGGRIASLGWMG